MRRILGSRSSRAALLAPLLLLALTGCSKDQSAGPKPAPRPATEARIQILQPTPNQETGPDVTVQVKLFGAKEVDRQGPPIVPTEGHVHVSLDGNIVAMTYGDTQALKGLTPGPHSVQVDYVATDHIPFSNRVTAGVLFTVK